MITLRGCDDEGGLKRNLQARSLIVLCSRISRGGKDKSLPYECLLIYLLIILNSQNNARFRA